MTEKGINLITKFTDDKYFFIMPDVGEEISKIQALKLDEKEEIKRKDELMRDFSVKSERIHSINQLLKAYTLFEKDTEYVVIDNKVKILNINKFSNQVDIEIEVLNFTHKAKSDLEKKLLPALNDFF